MYKLLLILRYLRKRRIAWVSLIAVTLCVAMELVVISVMGGWLTMFRQSFHGLSGDVIVHGRSLAGFPHYEEMIKRVESLPEIEAAVPTIRTFGLINIRNVIRDGVQVLGFPEDIGRVNHFVETLHLQYEVNPNRDSTRLSYDLLPDVDYQSRLPNSKRDVREMPGMIVGAGVVGIRKNAEGEVMRPAGGAMYDSWARLTVLSISEDSTVIDMAADKSEQTYWIVDDSRTQIYQYDSATVYVPFNVLQKDLRMDAFEDQPARTTDIQVKVKPGIDLQFAKTKVAKVVNDVLLEHDILMSDRIEVETWEESQALFLEAIENEKLLVVILFGIISLVAVLLIFCIFWMVVAEKTKDIGIIKSVGATNGGILGIFLGYGLAIGIVGAGLGFGAAYFVVSNINELHAQLGKQLGLVIWKPEVYAFDTIPSSMNPNEVIVILLAAVLSSVFGALVPSILAARKHPVEALRWE